MTRIDLIPPELVEKHRSRQIIGLMAAGFGIVFAILLLIYLLTLGQIMLATARVDQIKKENTKVQTYISNLKPYEERKKLMDSREQIINTILADQVVWSSILNDISMVVPNDVWLKEINIDISSLTKDAKKTGTASKTQAKPAITITGYAFDHAAVARWLVHLNEINQFRAVWLNYATEQTLNTTPGGTTGTTGTTTTATTSATGTAAGIKVIEFQTTVQLTKFSSGTKETAKQ